MTSTDSISFAGRFDPKTVVTLIEVQNERALRAEHGVEVDKRLADEEGNVSFSGLDPSKRYFACAYLKGRYVEERCRVNQNAHLEQPPVKPNYTPPIGTDEVVVKDPPPALPSEPVEKASDPHEEDDRPYDDFNPAPDSPSSVTPAQTHEEVKVTGHDLDVETSAPDGAGSQPEASSAPTP